MTVLLHDTFTDTNGTEIQNHIPDIAPLGQRWSTSGTSKTAVFTIQDNKASYAYRSWSLIEIGNSDYSFEVTLSDVVKYMRFGIRASDSDNLYWFVTMGETSWQLFKTVGGSSTSVASFDVSTPTTDGQRFKVICSGDTIEFYDSNGVISLTYTDTFNSTASKVSLNGYTSGGSFDDLLVESLGTTDPPSSPPIATIVSISKNEISDEPEMDRSTVTFTFDQDVIQWTVNVLGTSHDTGTVADYGTSAPSGTEITAEIDYMELAQEGDNRVNIYGQNSAEMWTEYISDGDDSDDIIPQTIKYLSMDGVDDILVSPSLAFTTIEIDINLRNGGSGSEVIDARPGVSNAYFSHSGNGSVYFNTGFNRVFADGVQIYSPTTLSKTRNVLRLERTTAGTASITISGYYDGFYVSANDIFDIKFYNGTTLVAHYDMSTGTIQDQSGNGNHATLNGGTWVEQ
jgi:hypothetical protein